MSDPRPASRGAAAAHDPSLLEALFGATLTARTVLRDELEREGLSTPMFWALHRVIGEGPLNVGQIAAACVVTSANVSSAVDDLVRAGLVARERPPQDRRVVLLRATPRGRSAHRSVWSRVASRVDASTRGLSLADLAAAARVLRRLAPTPDGPAVAPEVLAA